MLYGTKSGEYGGSSDNGSSYLPKICFQLRVVGYQKCSNVIELLIVVH